MVLECAQGNIFWHQTKHIWYKMPLTVVVQYYKLMNKIVKNHWNRGQGIIVTPVTLFKFYTIFQDCFLQRTRKSEVNLGKWKGAKLQRKIIIYIGDRNRNCNPQLLNYLNYAEYIM